MSAAAGAWGAQAAAQQVSRPTGVPPEVRLLVAQGVSVIWTPHGVRHPVVKGWPDLAATDADTLARWATEHRGCGWAAVFAPPFFCLDIDGRQGVDWLQRHEAKHGRLVTLRDHRSGRLGGHVFLRAPRGLRVASRILEPGVEVKGARHSVAIPPSQRDDGDRREWVDRDATITPAPAWLSALVGAKPRPPRPAPPASPLAAASGEVAPYAAAALARHLARVESAPEGARRQLLNGSVYSIAQLAGAGLIDPAIVEREFDAAARRMIEPLPERELTDTIRRALEQGMADPYYPAPRRA